MVHQYAVHTTRYTVHHYTVHQYRVNSTQCTNIQFTQYTGTPGHSTSIHQYTNTPVYIKLHFPVTPAPTLLQLLLASKLTVTVFSVLK